MFILRTITSIFFYECASQYTGIKNRDRSFRVTDVFNPAHAVKQLIRKGNQHPGQMSSASSMAACMLVLVFIFQIFNTAFYTHSHKLSNGEIITHAHPYDKGNEKQPFKPYHHSGNAITILQSIRLLYFSGACLSIFPVILLAINITNKSVNHYVPQTVKCQRGRDPPILLFI